ncbi:MAG: NADPH:quinone oxidoreductase family protein [Gammaproteobacteria bacterium]
MKALRCNELGGPDRLSVENIPTPEIKSNEVLVAIRSASVNFPDVLMIQGLYQYQPPLPFTPGAEAAGTIEAIGLDVKNFKIGDRVFIMAGAGCFAEKIAVEETRIQPIPDGMDFDVAAALAMTYGTSIYALKQRANIQAGETLLVMGASGGVGLSAVELGKAFGAKVIAAVSSEEKASVCKEHGADETIIYPANGLDRDQQKEFSNSIKNLTNGLGANVVYDPVGGSYAEPAIRATAWDGRYLVIGFAAGEIPKPPLNLALLKNCQIVGVFWGAWTTMFPSENLVNFNELFSLYKEKKINPRITDRFNLDNAADAIAHLGNRKAVGKVLVDV